MKADISGFKHLWDGSEPGWILFGEAPFNVLTSMVVLIEDNNLLAAVVEEMLQRGAPVARTLDELEAIRTRLNR